MVPLTSLTTTLDICTTVDLRMSWLVQPLFMGMHCFAVCRQQSMEGGYNSMEVGLVLRLQQHAWRVLRLLQHGGVLRLLQHGGVLRLLQHGGY